MLYAYGIVETHGFSALAGEGLEGGDVFSVACGGFAAAVSRVSSAAIAATPPNVRCHERVLARLMREHAVLPLRFGTICRDEQALRACLPDSPDGFRRDFARVRGRIEMALRLTAPAAELPAAPPPTEPASAGRGAAYLRTRLRDLHGDQTRQAAAAQLQALLRSALDGVPADIVCTPPADDAAFYRVSCLIARDRVAAFADALAGFCAGHPQFDVTCSGPWAPYSFVTAGAR